MVIVSSCTYCNRRVKVAEENVVLALHCPYCQTVFTPLIPTVAVDGAGATYSLQTSPPNPLDQRSAWPTDRGTAAHLPGLSDAQANTASPSPRRSSWQSRDLDWPAVSQGLLLILLGMLGSLGTHVLELFVPAGTGQSAGILLFVLHGFSLLVQLGGMYLCLSVPLESGARGMTHGAVYAVLAGAALVAVAFLITAVIASPERPRVGPPPPSRSVAIMIRGLCGLLGIATFATGQILFVVSLRGMAACFKAHLLAVGFIVYAVAAPLGMLALLAAIFFLFMLTPAPARAASAPPNEAIIFLRVAGVTFLGGVYCLLLSALRRTINRGINTRSLPQETS